MCEYRNALYMDTPEVTGNTNFFQCLYSLILSLTVDQGVAQVLHRSYICDILHDLCLNGWDLLCDVILHITI